MKPIDVIERLKSRWQNTDIDWESMLEHGYRCFLTKDSVVLDVGGHAGRHTEVFANDIGCARIEVVEPLPRQAQALRERYAHDPRIRVHEFALGAEAGRASFVFNAGAPEESGLRERRYNDPAAARVERLEVELSTVDLMCASFDRLDFVKIDTEGGEVDILEGGEATLRRLRPILSVEYGAASYEAYGKTRHTLYQLMARLDYGLFDLFGHPLSTSEDWDECVDNYYWDYFAAPLERAVEFEQALHGQLGRVESCLAAHARVAPAG